MGFSFLASCAAWSWRWVGLGIDYGMRAGHQLRYLRGRRPTPAAQPIDYTRRTSRRTGRWGFLSWRRFFPTRLARICSLVIVVIPPGCSLFCSKLNKASVRQSAEGPIREGERARVSRRGHGGAAGTKRSAEGFEQPGGCPTARSRWVLREGVVMVEAGRGGYSRCNERLWAAAVGGR